MWIAVLHARDPGLWYPGHFGNSLSASEAAGLWSPCRKHHIFLWDTRESQHGDPFNKKSPSPQICSISFLLHPDLGTLNPLPFNSNRFPLGTCFQEGHSLTI